MMSDKEKLRYMELSFERLWDGMKEHPEQYTTEDRISHLTTILYELIRIIQRQG